MGDWGLLWLLCLPPPQALSEGKYVKSVAGKGGRVPSPTPHALEASAAAEVEGKLPACMAPASAARHMGQRGGKEGLGRGRAQPWGGPPGPSTPGGGEAVGPPWWPGRTPALASRVTFFLVKQMGREGGGSHLGPSTSEGAIGRVWAFH